MVFQEGHHTSNGREEGWEGLGKAKRRQSTREAVFLGVRQLPLSWVWGYRGATGHAWQWQRPGIDGNAAWLMTREGERVSDKVSGEPTLSTMTHMVTRAGREGPH